MLYEPPLTDLKGENGAPVRRSATAETADLLADLVVDGVRTLSFVRSRRGAEVIAASARRALTEVSPDLADRVAAYRSGYLPEDRRMLETALRTGELLGMATTNALELGVDVSGLEAVLLTGYPGTLASLWQQAGRAGRRGETALAVFVARDDPLDTYLVHHPAAIFGRPVEAAVLDPDNPYVLAPHLECAAAELPITEADLELFGPEAPTAGRRSRPPRPAATPPGRLVLDPARPARRATCAAAAARRSGLSNGPPDGCWARSTRRPRTSRCIRGAIYLHQGETYLVDDLDLDDGVALVQAAEPDWTTSARDVTDIAVVETLRSLHRPELDMHFGTVDVTSQVVSYLRRRIASGEVLGEEPLDLPARQLRTRAVWYAVTDELLAEAGLEPADVPGAAHAAEHAAIGLLPLFATCDRWDIGGVSTALHADTGRATVFVYDGHPGGAGFAERAYERGLPWLRATRDAIAACECATGCPSCVQSPKCGNGNSPLDKAGAVRLLTAVISRLD